MGFHLFSNSGQIQYGIKNYIADFKSDLKNIPKNPGNMVFVIEESKYYITNNKQDWVEYKVNNSTNESDIEIDITENGSHDVSFATTANINVPQGVFPEGTKQINLTSNGTTIENVENYTQAEIIVNTLPEKGLVFEDYDSGGYPHSARFVGAWTEIPNDFCVSIFNANARNYTGEYDTVTKKIDTLTIPEGVTKIGYRAFRGCNSLKTIQLPSTLTMFDGSFNACYQLQDIVIPAGVTTISANSFAQCYYLLRVIFNGEISTIGNGAFNGCTSCALYDFSNCSAIPTLYSVASLSHSSGCVIRIPAALSNTTLGTGNGWQSATNWSALTNIVWEVV